VKKDERPKKMVQQQTTTTSSFSSGDKKPIDLENLPPPFKAIVAQVEDKNKKVLATKMPCLEA
jgi:hypothetical protein